ncbi:hypothetical protein IWQ60_004436 [Tieghemiomyces parasiticus]|uniref:Prefoldin subunit 1 n=1 Tax=Tieghemiomyces parasiticus TaxID=78921 RepID=A0A9W8DZS9_9FUNG|nr:hypothetical protein IWQ60_004436 [Tieghemiomyces parasiticus]
MQAQERERRRNELTLKEIESLPDDVATYKSVGKMFLQVDQAVVVKDLKKSIEQSIDTSKGLEKKQKYVERELNDCSTSLRDIMHHGRDR